MRILEKIPFFLNRITCFTKQTSLDKPHRMFIIGSVWQSCVMTHIDDSVLFNFINWTAIIIINLPYVTRGSMKIMHVSILWVRWSHKFREKACFLGQPSILYMKWNLLNIKTENWPTEGIKTILKEEWEGFTVRVGKF